MKTSYPFLKISQKHQVPYEEVLLVAEYTRYMGQPLGSPRAGISYQLFRDTPNDILADIFIVNNQFHDILIGKRDWSEGFEIS